MEDYIRDIENKEIHGIVTCVIQNVPLGLVSLFLINFMLN
jgi:hypothetical protein